MAEEVKDPSGTPETEAKGTSELSSSRSSSNADFPTLFGNIGILIDSSIESITGVIDSANSVTKQVSENITLTVNSDTVKGVVDTIGSLSQNVIQGVNDTLNSEQLKKTFDELGNLAGTVIDSAGSVARSEQAQNLFNTISSGLNQLLQTIINPSQSGVAGMQAKKAVEIPFCHKTPCEPSGESPEPEKQQTAAKQPPQQQKGSEKAQVVEQEKKHENVKQETGQQNPDENKKVDLSRKGTIPRQQKRNN